MPRLNHRRPRRRRARAPHAVRAVVVRSRTYRVFHASTLRARAGDVRRVMARGRLSRIPTVARVPAVDAAFVNLSATSSPCAARLRRTFSERVISAFASRVARRRSTRRDRSPDLQLRDAGRRRHKSTRGADDVTASERSEVRRATRSIFARVFHRGVARRSTTRAKRERVGDAVVFARRNIANGSRRVRRREVCVGRRRRTMKARTNRARYFFQRGRGTQARAARSPGVASRERPATNRGRFPRTVFFHPRRQTQNALRD